jgi:hypothetical protein
MTRINLVKYGFVRCPEEDFSDDGNRFICYRFSDTNSHVSKLVADGQAYLSCHVSGNLPYDIYSKLPHYKSATWDFNGVSVSSLTDALLQDFFNSCVDYEREYQEAENQIVWPTIDELTEKCKEIVSHKHKELADLYDLVSKNLLNATLLFSEYEWKRIKECITRIDEEIRRFNPVTYPVAVYKTQASFRLMQPNYEKDCYWSKSLKEVFAKYGLSSI